MVQAFRLAARIITARCVRPSMPTPRTAPGPTLPFQTGEQRGGGGQNHTLQCTGNHAAEQGEKESYHPHGGKKTIQLYFFFALKNLCIIMLYERRKTYMCMFSLGTENILMYVFPGGNGNWSFCCRTPCMPVSACRWIHRMATGTHVRILCCRQSAGKAICHAVRHAACVGW